MRMNNIVEWADDLVFTHTGEHLDDLQQDILREVFQGKKYARIAQNRSVTEGHVRDVASQLWKILSEALGENIRKSNVRSTMERLHYSNVSHFGKDFVQHIGDVNFCPDASKNPKPAQNRTKQPQIDLGTAPEITRFYGRTEELETLKNWIINDRTSLIFLLGLPGIGKTTLAVKLIETIKPEFDRIIYYSLQFSPPLTATLTHLLQFLTDSEDIPQDIETQYQKLRECLQRDRTFIILDDLQALFAPQTLSGHYKPNLENYRTFWTLLQKMIGKSHILLIGDEKPREFVEWDRQQNRTQILELKGLGNAATQILQAEGLSDDECWEKLCDRYQNHPLWLQWVSRLIRDFFQGNVRQFLEHEILLIDPLQEQYDRQFKRLSDLEQELLQAIAAYPQPISLETLLQRRSHSPSHILNAIQSLKRRLWLQTVTEEQTISFSIAKIIRAYLSTVKLTS
nr:ATP-binding protein [Spirulina major]